MVRLVGWRGSPGLYLINILGGAFAITVVPSMLVVQGDLVATAQNIQAHELLYRSGLAAQLLVTTTNVPLAVIFYELFKVVNRRLALLDACFILPRTIGVLLAIDGLAYLCYSFTDILAPDAAAHLVPWIQLPALIGEGSLCLWLLVVGINLERWNQQRTVATELQPT